MALRRALFALSMIWFGCTKPPPPVFERNNSILSILEVLPESFHLPGEFAGLVKSSTVGFEFVAFPQPIAEDWSFKAVPEEPSIYTNVVSDGKARKVFIDEPPSWLLELYQLGERYANVENNLEEARRTLNRAIVAHPKYFKSYTVYGKVLVQKERWNEAMPFLQKALELNSLDWEAHYCLGKAFQGLLRYDEAMRELTFAHLLNRQNADVLQAVTYLARGQHLDIRKNRMIFPMRIREVSPVPKRVDIEIEASYEKWMRPLAGCMAMWQHDPDYPETILAGLGDPLSLTMYRECLTVHSAAMRAVVSEKGLQALPESQQYLLLAMEDRHLEPILLWEIATIHDPYLPYLLHPDQREKIHRYIHKWVLVKMSAQPKR